MIRGQVPGTQQVAWGNGRLKPQRILAGLFGPRRDPPGRREARRRQGNLSSAEWLGADVASVMETVGVLPAGGQGRLQSEIYFWCAFCVYWIFCTLDTAQRTRYNAQRLASPRPMRPSGPGRLRRPVPNPKAPESHAFGKGRVSHVPLPGTGTCGQQTQSQRQGYRYCLPC